MTPCFFVNNCITTTITDTKTHEGKSLFMDTIIYQLLLIIQYQYKQICWFILFIARYIPLKQWAHDELHSPKYQKFLTDKLPIIIPLVKQDWQLWNEYYRLRYGKATKPVKPQKGKTRSVPSDTVCPICGAPHEYIYDNSGGRGQFKCKICGQTFVNGKKVVSPLKLLCPYCGHALQPVKNRKHFRVHKCVNSSCSYYKRNFKKIPKNMPPSEYWKYKLHYLYREFSVNFFDMDLSQLPKWATSFKYKKNSAYIMGLCLTYRVNLKLSLRQTVQALREIHNIEISHTMVNSYAKTAAVVIKPFVDSYDYKPSNQLTADETYIKVRGAKAYVWLILDKVSRSILGYWVSMSRDVGPCILAMRMAFDKFKEFPGKALKFVADGYSAYPLAAQQFKIEKDWDVSITQVIGLTNDDEVSKEHRPFKQIIERLNRTFRESYRITCGYKADDGAVHSTTLWVAYYNFLRPHEKSGGKKPLNQVELLEGAGNMPGKWQLLIYLGQQQILKRQTCTAPN